MFGSRQLEEMHEGQETDVSQQQEKEKYNLIG